MSRNFIPAALAIGVGILTGMTLQPFELLNPQTYDWISLPGYYTFQPALQELQIEKRKPLSYVSLPDCDESPRIAFRNELAVC